jgi:hypothetical protein
MDILAGASHQEGQMTAGGDLLDEAAGFLLKNGQAPGLIRGGYINQMVRDALAFFHGRLGSADIHPAVKQA